MRRRCSKLDDVMWDAVGAWKRIESGVSDFADTAAVFAGEGYRICTRRYRCFMRTIEKERDGQHGLNL